MTPLTRRKMLVVGGSGLVTVFSGCIGGSDDGETDGGDNGGSTANVVLDEAELFSSQSVTGAGPDGEVPWARVDVVNPTESYHGQVTVQVRFYDNAGSLMDTRQQGVIVVPPDTTWRYYQRFTEGRNFQQGRNIADRVEADFVEDSSESISIPSSTNVEVVNSEMAADSESGVTVTGELDITGGVNRVALLILVYDNGGRLRGTLQEQMTGFSSGQRVRFESSEPFIRTPPDIQEQVVSHEVIPLHD